MEHSSSRHWPAPRGISAVSLGSGRRKHGSKKIVECECIEETSLITHIIASSGGLKYGERKEGKKYPRDRLPGDERMRA
jgi:hypothetical protein